MTRTANKFQEGRLLNEIGKTEGFALSLMDLVFWTHIPYATAWRHLHRLEKANKVTVNNRGRLGRRRGGLKIGLRKPLPTEQPKDQG